MLLISCFTDSLKGGEADGFCFSSLENGEISLGDADDLGKFLNLSFSNLSACNEQSGFSEQFYKPMNFTKLVQFLHRYRSYKLS